MVPGAPSRGQLVGMNFLPVTAGDMGICRAEIK